MYFFFYKNNYINIINFTIFIFSFFLTYEILSFMYSVDKFFNLYSYIYWFFLGILSTIGFGFGLHTGTFFLIPNILNIYNETSIYLHPQSNLKSFVFLKSLPIVMSWGIGSAVGELPPYLISKYSQNDYKNIVKKLNINTKYINYMKKNSFFVITLMASWPNMTFDFVGVLCGINNISVMSFLVPTIIGKAFIKAPLQAFCIIYFYSEISFYIDVKDNSTVYKVTNGIFMFVIFYFMKNLIETLANNEKKK